MSCGVLAHSVNIADKVPTRRVKSFRVVVLGQNRRPVRNTQNMKTLVLSL